MKFCHCNIRHPLHGGGGGGSVSTDSNTHPNQHNKYNSGKFTKGVGVESGKPDVPEINRDHKIP